MRITHLLVCTVLLAITLVLHAESYDYATIFDELSDASPEVQLLHDELLRHQAQGDFNAAIDSAYAIIEASKAANTDLQLPLINLALIQAAGRAFEPAINTLNRAIDLVEAEAGLFSPQLIRPLQLKGLIERMSAHPEESESALRRAQHLIHRNDGVYSPDQQSVLDQLTLLHVQNGHLISANREQKYLYSINAHTWGENSEKMIPAANKYATFLRDIGNFRESVALYRDSIDMIERKFGPNDLRLIEPLQGIAEVRLLQREILRYGYAVPDSSRLASPNYLNFSAALGRDYYLNQLEPTPVGGGDDALERVLDIVKQSPGTDPGDLIRAMVELGDMYVIISDSQGLDVYMQAWQMMDNKPELNDLKYDLFGLPKRIHPRKTLNLPLLKDKVAQPFFANAELTVKSNGRTGDIQIVDSNIPNDDRRSLKRRLYQYRYRPRIVDGEFVSTQKLAITQNYHAIGIAGAAVRARSEELKRNNEDQPSAATPPTAPDEDMATSAPEQQIE